ALVAIFNKTGGEVIVAGGAFNTPQLLNLSGIGDHADLQQFQSQIRIERAELKGVGKNLQDRYETTYITEMENNFAILGNCTFGMTANDPCKIAWRNGQPQGSNELDLYATNGFAFGVKKKSSPELQDPDLFIFGGPAQFKGYEPKYVDKAFEKRNLFTWAVLKGQTINNSGYVKLKSANWAERPEINFRYFDDNNPATKHLHDKDIEAVANGMKFAKKIMEGNFVEPEVRKEVWPPSDVMNNDNKLRDHVRHHSWGHHASCTAKMGRSNDPMAVIDHKFRVFHTDNLRIVDASIFPKIPGLFIAAPIYMMSEKAFDVISYDYKVRTGRI
ncbi:GMC oxidoreductase, partial [Dolichospermum sp. ST_sed1]|nr:GMC oxidoreductase [Dolichospermum sp. ST_sed1]